MRNSAVHDGLRLTMSQKIHRLKNRLQDPEWRRYMRLVLGGKMLAVGILMLLVSIVCPGIISRLPSLSHVASMVTGSTAFAQATTEATTTTSAPDTTSAPATTAPAAVPLTGDACVSPINTTWVLVAAFLVFGMQVGFTMLEAGFCRSRETVNVLVECVFDTCLCGLLFYACGFAFMFGHGNGFIGWGGLGADGKTVTNWFFLQNAPDTYEGTGVAFLAVWIFQFAFADTCSTVTSGSMIGRTAFLGDIIYSCFVSGLIYPIIGHWSWGPDGWLATMGSAGFIFPTLGQPFHDFAGSTVVHSIGGFVAIAGSLVLGPRLGRKFKRDGGTPMPPHDLTIAVSGGLLLWFGWYGFNPGSTLSAMDYIGIGRVATNTTLAACAGGMTAIFWLYMFTKKWDCGVITNGFLAGLVAITCPCYWVSPTGAVILGGIAGVIVVLGCDLLEYLRIDDPIGAFPVHGICGVWGTLSLGLFACGKYGATGPTGPDNSAPLAGVFYGGGFTVLEAQMIGSFCTCVATFVVSFIIMYAIHLMGHLRISKEGELEGMDIHEHGVPAYPEYVYAPSASPTGLAAENVNSGYIKP